MNRLLLCSGCSLLLAITAFALIDTNENNLSDLWEEHYNDGQLFAENFDPQADADSDGWTNEIEAVAGTDPNDPNSPDGFLRPQIAQTPATWHDPDQDGNPNILTPETLSVSWPTIVGKHYTLQVSPDLSAGSWIEPDPPIVGNGNIIDVFLSAHPARQEVLACRRHRRRH